VIPASKLEGSGTALMLKPVRLQVGR
jgi:hypothetical protein